MPIALLEPLESPPRKRWTRAECEVLGASGLLAGQHFELIDGELIDKMGKNRPHVRALVLLKEWAIAVFGYRRIQQEAPIDVAPEDNPANEPQPDLVILRESVLQFRSANPKPQDIAMVIEVSDSTLSFDLGTKAALYARAGIPDYWVLDVNKRRLFVHRKPIGSSYSSVVVYHGNECIAPLAAPQSTFRVAAAFEE